MQLHTINTGNFKLDGGAMFGVVPKSIWHKLNPADEHNLCTWAMRCLLVQDGNKLILIDTGIGNKQSDKFYSHYHLHGTHTLEHSLQQLGYSTTDITDVVLTHLHFDHCGGAVYRHNNLLKPTFTNATYWSNIDHWAWATVPNDREKASFLTENIMPLQQSGQLQLLPSIHSAITATHHTLPSMGMKYANGHTNHMMLPVLQYKGHTIVYMADLLPSIAHIPLPYIMGYDMFPYQTLQEKKLFLQEALDNNYLLYFEHDKVHELCSLTTNDKGQIIAGHTMPLSSL